MNNIVRVRFAPSPTGYLHIGGLRTALFNYLFARRNNGKFILRIEDTDQARKVEGAVENLIHLLNYMGLNFDEGPGLIGDSGPYFQSQRLEIYNKYINELVENEFAYYAFETQEEIEEMRKEQSSRGLQTMYDRRARNLSKREVKEKIDKGMPYVIRLQVPLDAQIKFTDLIRGDVSIDSNLVDDQVLMKSDGFPTYHFANVIDDHLMQITHVIRGEEWLTSVPKHILLYNAFGWEVPEFAHVPLILNSDRTKLSKRQGDVATEDFLKKGYLKEALLNYIALLGWNPGEGIEREIYSLEELAKMFSIENINSSGAIFNIEKLNWMNAEYIKNYEIDKLTMLAKPFLQSAGYNISDEEKTKRVLFATRTYINRLDEIPAVSKIYYSTPALNPEQETMLSGLDSKKILFSLLKKVNSVDSVTVENFKKMMKEVQEETGIKGKSLYQPIRFCLTAMEHGPDLGLIAYVLGKIEVQYRIQNYVNL